jgi:hypothetical protein
LNLGSGVKTRKTWRQSVRNPGIINIPAGPGSVQIPSNRRAAGFAGIDRRFSRPPTSRPTSAKNGSAAGHPIQLPWPVVEYRHQRRHLALPEWRSKVLRRPSWLSRSSLGPLSLQGEWEERLRSRATLFPGRQRATAHPTMQRCCSAERPEVPCPGVSFFRHFSANTAHVNAL